MVYRHKLKPKAKLTPVARLLKSLQRRAAARSLIGLNLSGEYRRAMQGPRNSFRAHLKYLKAVSRSSRVRRALRDALTIAQGQAHP